MSNALIREKTVFVAVSNLGFGETTANNEGRFLELIGAPKGSEWCAYFAWYCLRRGAELAGVPLPFKGSGNAKRLGAAVGKCSEGFSTKDPLLAMPGDIVVWNRGLNPLTGHVGVIELVDPDGILHTIEGNVGKFPAKVKRLIHAVTKERLVAIYGLR